MDARLSAFHCTTTLRRPFCAQRDGSRPKTSGLLCSALPSEATP